LTVFEKRVIFSEKCKTGLISETGIKQKLAETEEKSRHREPLCTREEREDYAQKPPPSSSLRSWAVF